MGQQIQKQRLNLRKSRKQFAKELGGKRQNALERGNESASARQIHFTGDSERFSDSQQPERVSLLDLLVANTRMLATLVLMTAVEFTAELCDGSFQIPANSLPACRGTGKVRVIILVENSEATCVTQFQRAVAPEKLP
jgi:hypothetical protein